LGLQPTPLWDRGLWVITRVPKAPTRGYNGGRCEPKAGRRAWGEVRTFEPLFWFRIRGMRNSGSNCKIADGPGSVYRCPGSWPRPRWLVRAVSQLRGGGQDALFGPSKGGGDQRSLWGKCKEIRGSRWHVWAGGKLQRGQDGGPLKSDWVNFPWGGRYWWYNILGILPPPTPEGLGGTNSPLQAAVGQRTRYPPMGIEMTVGIHAPGPWRGPGAGHGYGVPCWAGKGGG